MPLTVILALFAIGTTFAIEFFCTKANGFAEDARYVLPGLVITLSLVADLFARTIKLQKSINDSTVFSNLSTVEKKELIKFHNTLHACSKNKKFGSSLLLANEYESLQTITSLYNGGAEFAYHDLVGANKTLLERLKKGERFHGVSMLTSIADWNHDERWGTYLQTNIRQAEAGVDITRIFVVRAAREFAVLQEIVKRLRRGTQKIKLLYIKHEEISNCDYFTDITVFPEHNLGLYVPVYRADPSVTVTHLKTMIERLEWQFEQILQIAHEFPANGAGIPEALPAPEKVEQKQADATKNVQVES